MEDQFAVKGRSVVEDGLVVRSRCMTEGYDLWWTEQFMVEDTVRCKRPIYEGRTIKSTVEASAGPLRTVQPMVEDRFAVEHGFMVEDRSVPVMEDWLLYRRPVCVGRLVRYERFVR